MDPTEYKPAPVDTSMIELGADLRSNIEALARNNHEVWAKAREAEGWTYGPARNDARKEHPGLVPYEQLSEAEKDIDRGTVVQTLKAAAAMGFAIHGKNIVKESDCPERPHAAVDDMSEWPSWPASLSGDTIAELDKTREAITGVYISANRSAEVNLFCHRVVARIIAVAGTWAVVLAILQLYDEIGGLFWARLEVWLAVIASAAVVTGLFGAFMRRWLVRRHRAERCRFLKFDFLLEVALAAQDRSQLLRLSRAFKGQAETIALLERDQMEHWLEEEQVLKNPPEAINNEAVAADMNVLAEHYLRTRLAVQSRYFFRQLGREERWNWQSQNLGPLLFAASVCFVFIHFLVEHYWKQFIAIGPFLVLLAATLPVVGAGIRGLRGISEYSRNTLRFKAKHYALSELIKDLEKDLAANQSKPAEIVDLLWKSEQVLEGEHREWLRLMMETEWIG